MESFVANSDNEESNLDRNVPIELEPEEQNETKTKNEPIRLGPNRYGCPFCTRIMISSHKMKVHIWTHTGEKPFTCNECNKAFNQQSTLTRHMKIHTGEKPFSCPFCDYSCIQKGDLKKHVISVHTKIQM